MHRFSMKPVAVSLLVALACAWRPATADADGARQPPIFVDPDTGDVTLPVDNAAGRSDADDTRGHDDTAPTVTCADGSLRMGHAAHRRSGESDREALCDESR